MSANAASSRLEFVSWNRRQWLGAAVAGVLLGERLAAQPAAAQEDALAPLNRFPRMVHEHFVTHVGLAVERSRRAYLNLRTREDAEQHVASVRKRIMDCFGPLPRATTPLNARITGKVERDEYVIEKLIYDSRPGFPVTANLYIPKGKEFPAPAVVGTCGHSSNGKAAEAYQSFAQGLARMGYVCLLYDPLGQGERLQYVNEDLTPKYAPGTTEHLRAGNQQYLVGEFLGSWRAWDGMRAVDYLRTRAEVDTTHMGVTGNSGGGTMTTWLCGVERRWTMAAPSCFVTSFLSNMENELPADTEQCPPRALALGLDHIDFLAAMAPRPVIILAKEKDYFDIRGGELAVSYLKRLYSQLGVPGNVALFTGPTYHGFTQENREMMYRWFNAVTEVSQAQKEPALTIEEDKTLWCTPLGQVAQLPGTQSVFDFTRRQAESLSSEREKVEGEQLQTKLREVLKLPDERVPTPPYRILRPLTGRRYPTRYAVPYAVQTEPGIHAMVYWLSQQRWYSRPPAPVGEPAARLYIAHRSADAELRDEPLLAELLQKDDQAPLLACDVRGVGESQPNTCAPGSFDSPYGCDYFYAAHSLMLDRPYLGQKTHDVLSVLDWLAGHGYTQVHLIGMGRGALPATFAAVLSDRVTQVTLKHPLTSYLDVAATEDYQWPLSSLLPGVLRHFDLPDCYQALADKQLEMIEPWDATQSG